MLPIEDSKGPRFLAWRRDSVNWKVRPLDARASTLAVKKEFNVASRTDGCRYPKCADRVKLSVVGSYRRRYDRVREGRSASGGGVYIAINAVLACLFVFSIP